MSSKIDSKAINETLPDVPTVESGKDTVETKGATDAPEVKAKRTRLHRGQACEIVKTTKNTLTGAIYDLILYKRSITNRRTGAVTDAFVGKKMRRPGTGVDLLAKEVEYEEDEE